MTTAGMTLISSVWTPSALLLGTFHEGDHFSFAISCLATYQGSVPVGGVYPTQVVNCTINVVPQVNRDSIIITGGSISGSLIDVFNRSIKYMKKDRSYQTVDGYSKIDQAALFKLISVTPASQSSQSFAFTCTAVETGEVKTYSITIQNDWTSDQNSLKAFVAQTNNLSIGDLNVAGSV